MTPVLPPSILDFETKSNMEVAIEMIFYDYFLLLFND